MKHNNKRELLIGAAIKVYSQKGSEGTFQEIITESKVPKTSAQREFVKEEIDIELHKKLWTDLVESIHIVNKDDWETNAVEKIKNLIKMIHLYLLKNIDFIKAVSKVLPPSPEGFEGNEKLKKLRLEVRAKHREFLMIMDQIIKDGQDKGYIVKNPPAKMIRQILMGGFEKIITDLYLSKKVNDNQEKNELLYTAKEAKQAINFLLESICTGKNKKIYAQEGEVAK